MAEDQVKIQKEASHDNAVCCSNGDYYPYGTSLNLENELIEQLGVESLAVGDVVEVHGFAFVERKSECSDKDGSERSLGLQLTSIKLRRENDDHAQVLYGDNS